MYLCNFWSLPNPSLLWFLCLFVFTGLKNPHLNSVVYCCGEDVLVLHGDLALLVQQHLLLGHKVIKVQGLQLAKLTIKTHEKLDYWHERRHFPEAERRLVHINQSCIPIYTSVHPISQKLSLKLGLFLDNQHFDNLIISFQFFFINSFVNRLGKNGMKMAMD